ncbi:MAG: hypothetical protein ACON5B_00330 [Myxococcota bacterium]
MRSIIAFSLALGLSSTALADEAQSFAGFKTSVETGDVWVLTSTCEIRIDSPDSFSRVCDAHALDDGAMTDSVVQVACSTNDEGFLTCASEADGAPSKTE